MDYIQGLNKEQKEAVLTKAKHVRVIAGVREWKDSGSHNTDCASHRRSWILSI
ncbi:hypothetical protein MX850_04450 [Erysipelothrix sp. Poltava]|nr:hypothetical protein MX850_04450 [Erysipelothrix sp. Poltava]